MAKERLDKLLLDRGLANTPDEAQRFVLAGLVWSQGQRLDKPGMSYPIDVPLEVKNTQGPYVSRAGLKLKAALEGFGVAPAGRVALDIGASTGGFTDCLLKEGADHVFAVDSGRGQLDHKLRTHPRVSCLEQTNARTLRYGDLLTANEKASELSLVVIDVSFISLEKILLPFVEAFAPLLNERIIEWVILYKPQFELEPKWIGSGGIVRDEAPVTAQRQEFQQRLTAAGYRERKAAFVSPLAGKKSGNLEYLLNYSLTSSKDRGDLK